MTQRVLVVLPWASHLLPLPVFLASPVTRLTSESIPCRARSLAESLLLQRQVRSGSPGNSHSACSRAAGRGEKLQHSLVAPLRFRAQNAPRQPQKLPYSTLLRGRVHPLA